MNCDSQIFIYQDYNDDLIVGYKDHKIIYQSKKGTNIVAVMRWINCSYDRYYDTGTFPREMHLMVQNVRHGQILVSEYVYIYYGKMMVIIMAMTVT